VNPLTLDLFWHRGNRRCRLWSHDDHWRRVGGHTKLESDGIRRLHRPDGET